MTEPERKPPSQPKSLAQVVDREEIFADLRRYDRTPFLRILADIMGCPPSLAALKLFADEHPDRWTFAVATLARVGGFTEKTEVVGNVHHHIHLMSDAELKQRIAQLEQQQNQIITGAEYEIIQDNIAPPADVISD